MMEKAGRQANYELLRIIAMWMVITLHYLNHTGMLPAAGEDMVLSRAAALLIESFCIIAVNLYVMISGYFLSLSDFSLTRLLRLLCQVWFYSLLLLLVMGGLGADIGWQEEGIYSLLPFLFPIRAEHYWFATSYVILYLLTPILNMAVRHMGRRSFQVTLAGLLLFFSVSKSVVPLQFVTDSFGYDFGWFICVYLTGAYFRRCRAGWEKDTALSPWLVYIACSLLTFGTALWAFYFSGTAGGAAYLTALPFHYNFILCLAAAAALFCAFGRIRIQEGRASRLICRLSSLTFGVYLFHEHILLRSRWIGYIEARIGRAADLPVPLFLLHWLFSVLLIYAAGSLVDALRLYIFRLAGSYTAGTPAAVRLKRLEEELKS